ncbi:MAG: PD-(D/E)XK nuclease family protein, partial [Oscillospiraceae bacterium]|nr:PD-(D/E)XK nuclease family protein [Oscillospiraceae bacterium]
LGIQMLLYLFTLQQQGEAYFGKPVVPAGVLYHPAKDPILSMSRNSTDSAIAAQRLKEQKRSGLLLDDAAVLQAMEHGAPAQAVYLPVGSRKDGTLTGSLATAEQLGKLGRHVDWVLRQIAGEIRRGNISADPCAYGTEKDACTYCPYRTVCCFDERYDRHRYLQKTDEKDFWQMMDEREEGAHGRHAD